MRTSGSCVRGSVGDFAQAFIRKRQPQTLAHFDPITDLFAELVSNPAKSQVYSARLWSRYGADGLRSDHVVLRTKATSPPGSKLDNLPRMTFDKLEHTHASMTLVLQPKRSATRMQVVVGRLA
jgi:hypothetical protein